MVETLDTPKPDYEVRLDELARELVNPERFGRLAVSNVIQLPLPETMRLYSEPA